MAKRPHRRKDADPLVPIKGEIVKAGIVVNGLTVSGAAKRISVDQHTLDAIVNGRTKQCYAGLRNNLGSLLKLPPEFLGGETQLIPDITPWLPPPGLSFGLGVVADENLFRPQVEQKDGKTYREGLPPRHQIAAHHLTESIVAAWKRDIASGNADAQEALRFLEGETWSGRAWDLVAMLVHRLASAFWWRRFFLRPGPLPDTVDPVAWKNMTDDEWEQMGRRQRTDNAVSMRESVDAAERVAVSAAEALRAVLHPWIDGKATLHYCRLARTLEWVRGGFGINPYDDPEMIANIIALQESSGPTAKQNTKPKPPSRRRRRAKG